MTITKTDPWLAVLADCRELSDLDEIRELGEWMTGGGCTCYGVEFDRGGSPLQVVLTDAVREAQSPNEDTDLVVVGVYFDSMFDGDTTWCAAEDVPLAAVPAVIRTLVDLMDDQAPLTDWSCYPPDQWWRMIAGRGTE